MRKTFHLSKCLLVILALSLLTCEPDERITPETSGSLLLGIELPETSALNGRIATNDKLSILFTIENESGEIILDQEVLKLIKLNKEYVTKPVSLTSGNYKIIEFMVINDQDEVIYMTPKEGSPLSYLVDHPTPILFSVTKNLITRILPAVLSTARKTPKDFGYTSFAFNYLETFDFLVALFAFNNETNSYELTNGSLQVKAGGEVVFDSALYAGTVKITLPANHDEYELIVTKPLWGVVSHTYTQDELEQHFSEADLGPLHIYLSKTLWEFEYGGGSEENFYYPPVFIGTSDGGFLFSNFAVLQGEYYPEPFSWIMKFSSQGLVEWSKTYELKRIYSIANTNDGGYVFTGPDISKTDENGNIQWEKPSIGGENVIQTQDNGYLVLGASLYKLTNSGDLIWNKEIGLYGQCAIEVLSGDGGFFIGGLIGDETAAAKISKDGEVVWLKSYGDLNQYMHRYTSIVHDGSGGFMMAGYYSVVCNIAGDGSLKFLKMLTLPDGWYPSQIIPSSSGFIIGNTTYIPDYEAFYCRLVEIDHQGKQLRYKVIDNQTQNYFIGFTQNNDGDFIIGGMDEGLGLSAVKVRFEN